MKEMKKRIAVIGGTGATGKEVVRQAIDKGYEVTIVARNQNGIAGLGENVKFVKGDVMNLESLEKALENVDFVVSCFGPAKHREVGDLMLVGTINIIKACQKLGIKRLVYMSGIAQADYSEMSFVTKLLTPIIRSLYNQSYKTKIVAETAIQNSDLNWVIVRAAGLNNSQPMGKYKAGVRSKIYFVLMSYADCAKCLLDAIDKKEWTRQIINVGKA